jgi:CHASE2 domain-containing sensor protein/tRNA A-37 threonylcarbamoyl transferase component Bud32
MLFKIELSDLWKSLNNPKWPSQIVTIVGISLGVASLVIGGKNLGWWEMGELAVYDGSLRSRPPLPPDPRILIVGISDEDLNLQKAFPLPDRTIAKAIQKLTDGKAKIIGLDLFRPNPVEPGHSDLAKIWDKNPLIVPVCEHRNLTLKKSGNAGPPGIPAEQLGFADLPVDRDSIARRALLFMEHDAQSPCTTKTSLALQLAQQYLIRQHQIEGQFSADRQFSLSTTNFQRLTGNEGGYQQVDSSGYQILINYRSGNAVAKIVSITDLLNDRVDPNLIKDRIVLIGSTASSLRDEFFTPYSAGKAEDTTMPGVVLHAQITSQIISAVLDQQPMWWFIPDWLEIIWIGGWSLTGSLLAFYLRHPLRLFIGISGAAILLIGGFAIAFINTGWLPLVSPFVGLIGSSIGVLGLISYQTQQQQQEMTGLVNDREQAIADLQLLLSQTSGQTALQVILPAASTPVTPPLNRSMAELSETTMEIPSPGKSIDLDLTIPDRPLANIIYQPQPSIGRQMPPNYLLDGRYQAESSLGSGGFGVTYLARDTKRPGKPQCVIKQLAPARRDPSFVSLARRLFNTEAEILGKLGHHAQIPHLLAYFEHEEEFYLVQEFIDGIPLDHELAQSSEPWGEARVLDFLRQLLPVLGFIHSQQVIHRDLKPGNIIRAHERGKLVLIDFGAVKEIQPQSEEERNHSVAIGTRGYTPPEQYAGHPNYTSDIFALGVVAIEALTGTHPRDLPVDERTGNLVWRDQVIISPALAQVLDKMVAYHFNDRYQSATAVLIDLP